MPFAPSVHNARQSIPHCQLHGPVLICICQVENNSDQGFSLSNEVLKSEYSYVHHWKLPVSIVLGALPVPHITGQTLRRPTRNFLSAHPWAIHLPGLCSRNGCSPHKKPKWHVIKMCSVCCVKCDYITKILVLHTAWTICPHQILYSTIWICQNSISELSILWSNLSKYLSCSRHHLLALCLSDHIDSPMPSSWTAQSRRLQRSCQ
jgi:hypothetical protein